MTDVVLSPIPYYGGTLQMGYHLSHYADMGNGKLLNVVVQTNPAYLFAYVTNVTNLKTGTLSSANGPMRALLSPSAGGAREDVTTVRVYKINATTALLKYGFSTSGTGSISYHRVITILPNDDVTLSTITYMGGPIQASTQSVFKNSDYEYGQNFSTVGAVGSYQNIWNVGDNILFAATKVAGQQFILQRVVYDPVAKTMTATQVFTQTNANLYYCRFQLQDIPNSTKKLFYVHGSSGSQSYQAATIVYAAIIEPSTGVVSVAGFVPAGFQSTTAMCALSETLVLGFATTTRYFSMSPASATTWGTVTPSTVFTQNGGAYHVAHAEALDTNYFAIFSHALGGNITTDSLYLRIGRYVDKDFGQVSSASNVTATEGINIGPAINPYVDEKFITRVSPDAFYIYGRQATGTYLPTIRVLYQAGG